MYHVISRFKLKNAAAIRPSQKKWLACLLCGIMALSVTGCGGKEEDPSGPPAPGELQTPQGKISLGMSQKEAEKILGEGVVNENSKVAGVQYGDSLLVYYRGNGSSAKCAFMLVENPEYTCYGGIKVGDDKLAVLDHFDQEYELNESLYSASFYQGKENSVMGDNAGQKLDCNYLLRFSPENNTLISIWISDEEYSNNLQ